MAGTERTTMPRGVVLLLAIAGAVVGLAGLHAISGLFAPVFLGLTLVICVHPLHRRLVRAKWPAWLTTTVCLVIVYLVIVILIVALVAAAARFATLLPSYSSQFKHVITRLGAVADNFGITVKQVRSALSSVNPGTVLGVVRGVLSGLLATLSGIALLVAVLLFMVADSGDIPRRLDLVREDRPALVAALEGFASGVRSYWLVSTVFGLIVAVLDTGALFLLSVPLALVWGLVSFLTNYIPNVGFVLGLIPPALLALLDGGWGRLVAVAVVYTVLNVVIQSVIQPRVVGSAVGLSATVSFLSVVFWGFVLGPLGALLAVPMTLLVKAILIDADPDARWANLFISGAPDTSAAADQA